MLYNLFKYLDTVYDLPGSGMFQYITFRSIAAFILALLMVIYIGNRLSASCRGYRLARRFETWA